MIGWSRSLLVRMAVASAIVTGGGTLLAPRAAGWILAAGVFLACAAVVALEVHRIHKMADEVTRHAEAQRLQPLPEAGVAGEVLPLVRAVNRRITRVASIGERQRFFLSAAAHEMRTPLTVVRTRLEQLDDGVLKDQLVTDVRRLTRLVNDLLTLMSIRGRERAMKPLDPVARCQRVIDALDTVAAARAVRLVLDAADNVPMVSGDAGLIDVAVTNLVQNAIAHSPLGGAVTVTVDRDARIAVRDQGPGIPDDKLDALFDPFVRLSTTPGGYGLGLTIVRAIADTHGAAIHASNAPDGGSVFVFDPGRTAADGAGRG